MFTCQIFTDPGAFKKLRSSWQSLVTQSETATPFQTYEWASSWWFCLNRLKKPYIITIYEGKDLVGLYPGYTKNGVLKILSPMGKGLSDYLHPLIQTGYEQIISNEIVNILKEEKQFHLVDFHQIRETHPVCFEDKIQKVVQSECFTLDLPNTFDEYVQTLSKSMRYEAKRIERGDFKHNLAHVQTVANLEEAMKGLKWLFELHNLRWKKKGLPGIFFLKNVQRFHEQYVQKALMAQHLKLAVYHHGGVIGVIYVIRVGHTSYFYQSGFDPSFKAFSPGAVLVSHSIRETIEEGGTCFDFLRGAEPYKARWKPQHCNKNLRIMIPVNSFRGEMVTKINSSLTHLTRQTLKKVHQTSKIRYPEKIVLKETKC